MGPVPRATPLNIGIGLPLRNQPALDLLIGSLVDPSSADYRHFLTPEEFTAQFAPTEADYRAAIAFAQAQGLTVTATHANRMLVDVSGSVGDIEKALHVNMTIYQHPVRGRFYAPDREPRLDLDVGILDISGLDNYEVPRPMALKARPLIAGSGPAGLLIGNDFRSAYAAGVTLDGTGQVVGLLEFDGFYASDLAANFNVAGLPPVVTQTVLLDGLDGAAGPGNAEVMLDIAMAGYMAPGLSKVIVYEGSNANDILNRMATDNLAPQISSSWSFVTNATTEQIFEELIAQGQSVYQASGDGGAYSGNVRPPSDNPNLTIVGGTSLTTSGAGGPWQSESAWTGSGGGVSTVYPIPAWQQGISMAANGGSMTMRNIPDVAIVADEQFFLICNNGQAVSLSGTSAAAPLWAGFTALANQKAAANGLPRVGFANPAIYAIGQGSDYLSDFHDIGLGNNGRFSALAGYDLATGWGTPAGQHLIDDLSGVASGITSVVASRAGFSLSASPAAIVINPSGSAGTTVTVVPFNGFTGSVALTVSGLPAGVTSSFNPASAATTSTITFVAGSAAVAGTSTITITGTSGSLRSTTTVTLQVVAPGFSLTASAGSVTVKRGSSATNMITVVPQSGFTGSVGLAASGLPGGVTCSFSPATATSTSTITFTAVGAAVAGTSTITITGTSGTLRSTTTIGLAVVVPGFSLTASDGNITVKQGSGGTSTISVVPQNGFTGGVSLVASGLPAGVASSFSPASATTTSTITFTAASTAVAGTSTITITGSSGSLRSTTSISLAIVVPGFSLTASASSITLKQGSSTTSMISVVPQNGFTGSVLLTASGVPAGVTASFSSASTTTMSIFTLTAGSAAVAGTSTITITGTSGSLRNTTTIGLTVIAPNFSLSISNSALSLPRGFAVTTGVSIGAVNGFTGNVHLVASGLPTGVTAAFSPASTATASQLTLTASSAAAAGTSTVTVTGTSTGLSGTAMLSLTLLAPSAGTTPVDLASVSNVTAIAIDGASFPSDGGLNGTGAEYSASLLGTQQTLGGTTLYFGSAGAPDAVSGGTVPLPAGQFPTIKLLATAVNGNQPSQRFTVTYSDGTTAQFVQSVSDWFTPQNSLQDYAGESKVLTMPYRDTSSGVKDNGKFLLYGYSFTLNAAKAVSSITLPDNRNVVVLAISLGSTIRGTPPREVRARRSQTLIY